MDLLKQQYPVEQQYLVKKQNTETQKIILLQLGDAGLNFCMDERDQKLKKELQDKIDELKTEGIYIQILFVRGNHEARPGNLESGNLDRYIEKEVYDGRAYIENNPKGPAFPDLIFLKDGEIYSIPDGEERKDFLAIGGGRSVDFFERFLNGMEDAGWWFDEELSDHEFEQILDMAGKIEEPVYVLSHMLPAGLAPERENDEAAGENRKARTELWLQRIADTLGNHVVRWLAGHYHMEMKAERYEIVYKEIRKLK